MPVIRVVVTDVAEMKVVRARYESEGFNLLDEHPTQVRLVNGDVIAEIGITVALPRTSPRRTGLGKGWIVVIALGVLASLGYAGVAAAGYGYGDCTVAAAGTAFNVQVSGLGADSGCDKALKTYPGALVKTQPTGEIVCQETQHFTTVTVRDQGILKILGTAFCTQLHSNFGAVPAPGASSGSGQGSPATGVIGDTLPDPPADPGTTYSCVTVPEPQMYRMNACDSHAATIDGHFTPFVHAGQTVCYQVLLAGPQSFGYQTQNFTCEWRGVPEGA